MSIFLQSLIFKNISSWANHLQASLLPKRSRPAWHPPNRPSPPRSWASRPPPSSTSSSRPSSGAAAKPIRKDLRNLHRQIRDREILLLRNRRSGPSTLSLIRRNSEERRIRSESESVRTEFRNCQLLQVSNSVKFLCSDKSLNLAFFYSNLNFCWKNRI